MILKEFCFRKLPYSWLHVFTSSK